MADPTPGTPHLLRAINDKAALEVLLERGPLTRPELGVLTGLSKPTASQLLARLRATGLVVHDGIREGGPGRTAELYRINPDACYVAGLDVTPARIKAAVADLAGTVVGRHELPTPGRAGGDVIARVRDAVSGAAGSLPLSRLNRVVIGVQGAVNPSTGLLGYAAHQPGWHIPALVRRLGDGLGTRVAVENDVNLAAVAERGTGAAADSAAFVLLWVGDGVGMAIMLGGVLHRGATGGAGEVGYMPVAGAPLIRDVRRKNTGGLQSVIGAPAVRALMRSHGLRGRSTADVVHRAAAQAARTDRAAAQAARTDRAAAQAARTDRADRGPAHPGRAGHPERASAALGELATRFATGLASIVSVLDPDLIVLAGDIAHAGGEPLREMIERELHTMTIPQPRLRLSTVTGNPVVAGALRIALSDARDELFSRTVSR